MRYDVKDRIMSLSFQREPGEHADVMLAAGRRMMTPRKTSYSWSIIGAAVGFGAVVGISMEIYRRFLLSPLLGVDEVTPLTVIVQQLLPLLLLIIALVYAWIRYVRRRRKQTLIDRLEPDLFVDLDVFRDGIRMTAGTLTLSLEWAGIRDILVGAQRIEFESDSFATYVPERAFENRPAFDAAAAQFRQLWLEAKLKQTPAAPDIAAPASRRKAPPSRH
jgi:hypothetical protein